MVDEVGPGEVAERLQREPSSLVLLDVREAWERAFAVILPSLHIPLAEISERIGELPRDRELIVYCHSGTRSAMVAGFLESEGFARVANLAGGIDAWSLEVDTKVPRY